MKTTSVYIDRLTELEQTLQRSLNPVKPDPQFVKELNRKLYTREPLSKNEKSLAAAYLNISFGLFFGVFIFWLVRKIVRTNRQTSIA